MWQADETPIRGASARSTKLEPSVTAEQWWAVLLQGSVGSVVGLVGLFLVFWLTRWHELDQAARRRTLDGAATVVDAAHRVSIVPVRETTAAMRELAHQLELFCIREITDHTGAAEWAHRQASVIAEMSGDSPRTAIRYRAGYVAGTLTAWVQYGLRDGVLSPDRVQPHSAGLTPPVHPSENVSTDDVGLADLPGAGPDVDHATPNPTTVSEP